LTRQQMQDIAEGEGHILRDVQSLTDWVWRINTKGSLAEAVGATSFAIEGVAGALARKVSTGFESYRGYPGVDMNPRTYKWIREHSRYDDEHPEFALEVVKKYAITERIQRQVMNAAKRSLELLNLALLTSTKMLSDPNKQ
jgi:pyrroloquinoline quinone (PQQ) biosynthesis protein C